MKTKQFKKEKTTRADVMNFIKKNNLNKWVIWNTKKYIELDYYCITEEV